jgi:hypothetical protein
VLLSYIHSFSASVVCAVIRARLNVNGGFRNTHTLDKIMKSSRGGELARVKLKVLFFLNEINFNGYF